MLGRKALLAVSLLSLLSGAAYATAPNPCCFCPHFYAGVEGGQSFSSEAYFTPHFSYINGDINFTVPENTDWFRNIGSSGYWGVFAGYQFSPNLGLQLTFDHRNDFAWKVPVSSPSSFPTAPFEEYSLDDIRLTTLFADLKLAPSVCWNGFVPFVKVGVGVSRNKTGTLRDVYVPFAGFDPLPQFDTRIQGKTKTEFAWNAGVGVDYYFTKCIALNLAYRVVDVGRIKSGNSAINVQDDDPVAAPIVPFRSDRIFLQEVVAAVTYHFG